VKVEDVGEVGEESVSAGAKPFRHQTLHLVARQLILVTLATTHHVTKL